MKRARLVLGDDTTNYILDDGTDIDLSGHSCDEIIHRLLAEGITHIEAREEDGASGMYGDLAPGLHGLYEYAEWLDTVGDVDPALLARMSGKKGEGG